MKKITRGNIILLMLHPQAMALAFTAASIIFYVSLVILKLIAPPLFRLILNSQFLGADIASQVPRFNFANLLGFLIAIAVFAWIFGYLIALFYNRLAKQYKQ